MRIDGYGEEDHSYDIRGMIYTGETAKGMQEMMRIQLPYGTPSLEDNEISKKNPDQMSLQQKISTTARHILQRKHR